MLEKQPPTAGRVKRSRPLGGAAVAFPHGRLLLIGQRRREVSQLERLLGHKLGSAPRYEITIEIHLD